MSELEVLRKTVGKLSDRIADLTLHLDLAYSQIDILNEQLKAKEEIEQQSNM